MCLLCLIYLLPDEATVRGETPLHLAARANQTDIIRILLRNGAKVDARARVRLGSVLPTLFMGKAGWAMEGDSRPRPIFKDRWKILKPFLLAPKRESALRHFKEREAFQGLQTS